MIQPKTPFICKTALLTLELIKNLVNIIISYYSEEREKKIYHGSIGSIGESSATHSKLYIIFHGYNRTRHGPRKIPHEKLPSIMRPKWVQKSNVYHKITKPGGFCFLIDLAIKKRLSVLGLFHNYMDQLNRKRAAANLNG